MMGIWNRRKVQAYDRTGKRTGELDLGGDQVIGGLAAYGNTLYLTDSGNRELKTFSLTDLHPLGAFSYTFDAQCADWRRESGLYQWMSLGSLIALVLFCSPVIIFYLKIKKEELKEISLSDLNALKAKANGDITMSPSADLIMEIPVNNKQQKMAIILLIAAFVCIPLAIVVGKTVSPLLAVLTMFSGLLPVGRDQIACEVRRIRRQDTATDRTACEKNRSPGQAGITTR